MSTSTELQCASQNQIAVPMSESAALMQSIMAASSNPAYNPENMRQMLDMIRQLKRDEAEVAFYAALAAVQAAMPRIGKDGKVKYPAKSGGMVDFTFATYENIDRAIRPLLAEHGLSISFDSLPEGNKVAYVARLAHKLGHSEMSRMILPADESGGKNAIQALGSTARYARRYLLLGWFNIVEEGKDDDAASVGFIGEHETNVLLDMLQLADDPVAAQSQFLKFMGVKLVSEIQKRDYSKAYNLLRDKTRQKMQRKAKDGPPEDLPDLKQWPDTLAGHWYKIKGVVYRYSEDTGSYREWKT